MGKFRTLQRSFGGGEISPDMYGRIDDVKYQSGLELCRNFLVEPQGPVEKRPGFQFVREVKFSTKQVRLIPFTYSTTQTMVIELGEGYIRFHTQGATLMSGSAPYEIANSYAEADLFDIHFVQSADVLTLVHPSYPPQELRRLAATNWQLTTISFAAPIAAPTGIVATSNGKGTEYNYYYVVTAIMSDNISESVASASATCINNIFVTGAINTITWNAVAGASHYNVYKMQGGLYGYMGQTTALTLIDDNIAPDLSKVPPIYDAVFGAAGDYPAAVSYFEQRRSFAGTVNQPQNIWMTKSGTESNMSYSLPTRSDDRVAFRVAAREANTIRHIVPLTQLLLLTSSAEWRITSINSDAITPTTISVRPQSYVGASNVQPVIINNTMLYCAARGGHVREMAYNWQAGGFISGDLSLRAAHLFDTFTIADMTYAKAPQPIVWFASSTGKLLGCTYVPEQQVGAWHQHDTDGLFESCAVVAEGDEDRLYCVVQRTINGVIKRYIERAAPRIFNRQIDAFFVDSGLSFDGTNTAATTVTLSGGTTWGAGEVLTCTASVAIFAFPATTDVGDAIVITDGNGVIYTATIRSTSSTTVATVQVDKAIPVALQSVATSTWSFARNSLAGLDHLEGKTVAILADGAVHPQRTVTAGVVTLDQPATLVHVGLPIVSDIKTLPVVMKIDSFGQGRFKNVNKAWLRVYRSSSIFVGPDASNLVEIKQRTTEAYGAPPALKSEEVQLMLTPSWADGGQVFIRHPDPLPLAISSLTTEISIGG